MSECIDHGQSSERYGYTSVGGRSVLYHRAVYASAHGLDVFTMGGVVMHSCDNPRCITGEHLTLRDQSANMQDMVAKGRANPPRGERSGTVKLSAQQVQEIIKSSDTQRALANRFGISQAQISRIKGGSRWTHLTR